MKITNLKIGVRLGLAFAVILALMASMIVIGVWRLQEVAQATVHMEEAATKERLTHESVSYTHLTLPTNREV